KPELFCCETPFVRQAYQPAIRRRRTRSRRGSFRDSDCTLFHWRYRAGPSETLGISFGKAPLIRVPRSPDGGLKRRTIRHIGVLSYGFDASLHPYQRSRFTFFQGILGNVILGASQ